MDLLTHSLLGALAAQSVSKQHQLRIATGVGFVAALLPDMDVLIRSANNPLLSLEYHRHFTHSLVFVPVGALLAWLLLSPLLCKHTIRKHVNNLALYGFAFLGYLSACLLDVCTSYGTHLFWPFSTTPVSLNIIAVVDPLFTLMLLIAGVCAWRQRNRLWAWLGIALAVGYLFLGWLQYERALTAADNIARDKNVTPARIIIKPTMGNIVLWRSIIVESDVAHVNAVRVGLLNTIHIYSGSTVPLVDPKKWQQLPNTSRAFQDIQRYYGLADKLLVEHPTKPNFVGDLRYSLLPNSILPMWGISIDPAHPDSTPTFLVDRRLSDKMRTSLWKMLLGEFDHTSETPQTDQPQQQLIEQ